jgi:ParB-like chromosome segregation protein Spo0J
MKLETLRIEDLVTDPNNARKHDEKNLEAIKGSLSKFGQRKPIVIQGNVVIAGNGTLEAARQLGWDKIEIVQVPEDWTAEQAKAFALADNRTAELAEWIPEQLQLQLEELSVSGFEVQVIGFEPPKMLTNDFQPDEIEQPRLDQRNSTTCPNCAFEWRVAAKGEIEPV